MKSGWYRWKGSYWHWFDNDQTVSACGGMLMPRKKWRIKYSRERPPQGKAKLDRVCLHCERMTQ